MAKTGRISVRIVADTREFRRQLLRAQLVFTRSWWRRLWLRFLIWRIGRESDPRTQT